MSCVGGEFGASGVISVFFNSLKSDMRFHAAIGRTDSCGRIYMYMNLVSFEKERIYLYNENAGTPLIALVPAPYAPFRGHRSTSPKTYSIEH